MNDKSNFEHHKIALDKFVKVLKRTKDNSYKSYIQSLIDIFPYGYMGLYKI